jgi:hypothetical protein
VHNFETERIIFAGAGVGAATGCGSGSGSNGSGSGFSTGVEHGYTVHSILQNDTESNEENCGRISIKFP